MIVFYEGSCSTAMYAFEFRHLTCDISWGEVAFMSGYKVGWFMFCVVIQFFVEWHAFTCYYHAIKQFFSKLWLDLNRQLEEEDIY
jgi:hypothetical protein